MIRPVHFAFNTETAVNNSFQADEADENVQEKAQKEFDAFVQLLQSNGIDVLVINDTPEPYTPDSIFPNNWISLHEDGTMLLYPMFAPNRRKERKPSVIQMLAGQFVVYRSIDLSKYENEEQYLEGTGSLVLDRDQKIAYACLSPRTHIKVLEDFCKKMDYRPVLFNAVDSGQAIYHTNVMMCVADRYVVICLDCIPDPAEKEQVIKSIQQSGKELIEITVAQMNRFAGNMLQVENNRREKILVMSGQAYHSLTPEQVKKLEEFNKIIHSPLDTIEANGGGSARCMMAEIFLPVNE